MAERNSILVIEDDRLVRDSVLAVLSREAERWSASVAGTLREARERLRADSFELALVDLSLPDGSALTLLPALRERRIAALVLSSTSDERTVYEALRVGAVGYLLKPDDIETVAHSLRQVLAGGSPIAPRIARWLVDDLRSRSAPAEQEQLSPREREMLELFAKGATYSQVADAMGIGVNTVRTHVRRVYEKLHVCTKTEAVLRGLGPR